MVLTCPGCSELGCPSRLCRADLTPKGQRQSHAAARRGRYGVFRRLKWLMGLCFHHIPRPARYSGQSSSVVCIPLPFVAAPPPRHRQPPSYSRSTDTGSASFCAQHTRWGLFSTTFCQPSTLSSLFGLSYLHNQPGCPHPLAIPNKPRCTPRVAAHYHATHQSEPDCRTVRAR